MVSMEQEKENIFASVIVPVYNGRRWIAECLDSALSQGRGDIEVLAVDDGSTDDTPSILAEYGEPVRVMTQDNGGVAAARNRAIQEARGKWIAFLDSDDRWLKGHIDAIHHAAQETPQAGLIYTDAAVIDKEGKRIKNKPGPDPGKDAFISFLLGNRITTSAAAVRRDILEKTGGFPEGLKSRASCEDWDLWLRIAASFPVVHVPSVTVEYRRQEDSAVQTQGISIRGDNLYVLSRALKLRDVPERVQGKAMANCYLESAVRLLAGLDTAAARTELFSALRHRLFLPKAWALFPATLAGPWLINRLLAWKRERESRT